MLTNNVVGPLGAEGSSEPEQPKNAYKNLLDEITSSLHKGDEILTISYKGINMKVEPKGNIYRTIDGNAKSIAGQIHDFASRVNASLENGVDLPSGTVSRFGVKILEFKGIGFDNAGSGKKSTQELNQVILGLRGNVSAQGELES